MYGIFTYILFYGKLVGKHTFCPMDPMRYSKPPGGVHPVCCRLVESQWIGDLAVNLETGFQNYESPPKTYHFFQSIRCFNLTEITIKISPGDFWCFWCTFWKHTQIDVTSKEFGWW